MRKLSNNNGVHTILATLLLLAICMPTAYVVGRMAVGCMNEFKDAIIDVHNTLQELKDTVKENDDSSENPTTPNPINNKPTISNIYPIDNMFNVPIQPRIHFKVSDVDRDILYVNLYYYNTTIGNFQKINQNIFTVPSDTTIYCNFTQAKWYCCTYNWYITVYDGTEKITSTTYKFKTMDLPNT